MTTVPGDRVGPPWGGYVCAALCLLTVPPGGLVALAMLLNVNFARGWQDHLMIWSGVAYPIVALAAGGAAISLFRHRMIGAGFIWLALPVANLALWLMAAVLVNVSGLPTSGV